MVRPVSLVVLSSAMLFASCQMEPESPLATTEASEILKQRPDPAQVPQGDPLTRAELDKEVIGLLERRNDFHWEWVDLRTLWSATLYNDHSVAIGYQPAGSGNIDDVIHQVDIHKSEWRAVHDALIDLVWKGVNNGRGAPLTARDIIVEDDPVLPIITFRLTNKEVITALHNLTNVRYIEPLDYWPAIDDTRSTSGCSPSSYALNAADHSTTTPNALVPWNYGLHNIATAWTSMQGSGITVGVIDAGLSSSQSLLGADFNNGDSNVGRTVSTGYTYGTSAYTNCSHGNSMSGLAVGPRNSLGATTGVAYRSSLHFIRASEDVLLDGSAERTGVKNAMIQMGDIAALRVISISLGTPFSSSVVTDGVNYAHGKGKMIIAAAGTSFSWTSWWGVVYPAALTKCVAVTGVKENGSKCSSCHDGSQVDLTIVMERNSNSSRNSLSLSPGGITPSYIGGSSAATATAAGIASLVWSVNASRTREQVLNCLVTTAQFYPNPSGSKGYGNINASAAVNCALAL